jgi:hypothetical protein
MRVRCTQQQASVHGFPAAAGGCWRQQQQQQQQQCCPASEQHWLRLTNHGVRVRQVELQLGCDLPVGCCHRRQLQVRLAVRPSVKPQLLGCASGRAAAAAAAAAQGARADALRLTWLLPARGHTSPGPPCHMGHAARAAHTTAGRTHLLRRRVWQVASECLPHKSLGKQALCAHPGVARLRHVGALLRRQQWRQAGDARLGHLRGALWAGRGTDTILPHACSHGVCVGCTRQLRVQPQCMHARLSCRHRPALSRTTRGALHALLLVCLLLSAAVLSCQGRVMLLARMHAAAEGWRERSSARAVRWRRARARVGALPHGMACSPLALTVNL